MLETINETVSFLKNKLKFSPEIAIILGSGLGGMVKHINIAESIPFEIIPGFQATTVEGHSGKLIFGFIGDRRIIAMQGRYHFYEGHGMKQITHPIRVFKYLGVKTLFLSNAAGGLNPDFEVGDMMIIEDHINLLPNPLIGQNISSLGPRFPDMSEAYDKVLSHLAEKIARENLIHLKKGIYVAVTGPSFETPAEYKYFRTMGGDAVGMSTVPEVIIARHMEMQCFAVSIISDLGVPGKIVQITHEEVLAAVEQSEPQLTFLFKSMIQQL
jgi:purine-nucleoside phosphorylase